MSDVVIPLHLGRKTSGDSLRYKPGFLTRCENAIYLPEDEDILTKILGRSSAATLPTSTSVKAIDFLKFDSTDQIVLSANSRLYEATAGSTLGSWTQIKDQQSTPVAFPRTGAYLRSIPDAFRRQIVWTGDDKQPLVRDRDGNWRELSMLKVPTQPTGPYYIATVSAATQRPLLQASGGYTTPTTTVIGETTYTVDKGFDTPDNVRDNDTTTNAETSLDAGEVAAGRWSFGPFILNSANGYPNPEGGLLFVRLKSQPTQAISGRRTYPILGYEGDYEHIRGSTVIRVSLDGGTSYSQVYAHSIIFSEEVEIQYSIPYNQSMSLVKVEVASRYTSGGGTIVDTYIPEIWVQEATSAPPGSGILDAATHQYVITEVYKQTLSNGETIDVEGDPCDPVTASINGIDHTAVRLGLPAIANGRSRGVHPENIFYRIYRSLDGGVYPDLGLIDEVAAYVRISSPVTGWTYTKVPNYLDTFQVGQSTLGSPALKVQYVQDTTYPLTSPAPSFLDATDHSGIIVAIPNSSPASIKWSQPGNPEYWPVNQQTRLRFQGKDYTGRGLVSVGENLLVFLRNGVIRIRNLPVITQPNFDVAKLDIDLVSPSEGLAASPRGYCLFHSQKGHAVVAWISDSGIWMTDGSLVSERGMGLVKLTAHKAWRSDVDLTRLEEAQLTYDPELQVIVFDYYDTGGTRRCEYLHTAALHWVESGQDQLVPKITGPHSLSGLSRCAGETGGRWAHWSMSSTKVLAERTGTGDDTAPILTHIESGWIYPLGPRARVQVYRGSLAHGDWGSGESCDLDLLVRTDETGAVQNNANRGISLRGNRYSDVGSLHGAGTSLKMILRHNGKSGAEHRYFGPLVLDAEPQDEPRKD